MEVLSISFGLEALGTHPEIPREPQPREVWEHSGCCLKIMDLTSGDLSWKEAMRSLT